MVLEGSSVIHWSEIFSEEAERNVQQVARMFRFFFFFKFLSSEEMFPFLDLTERS